MDSFKNKKQDSVILLSFLLVSWMLIVQIMFPSRLGVNICGILWMDFFSFSGKNIFELIISSISHANYSHLIGNIYGLLFFVVATNQPFKKYSYIEFFILFISLGIISNGLSFVIYSAAAGEPISIIGSSGAVIGLYGYHFSKYMTSISLVKKENSYIPKLTFLDESINQYLLVGFTSFYILLTVQQQLVTGLASVQTAHLAHIIGFVFGSFFFIVEYYKSENKEKVDRL